MREFRRFLIDEILSGKINFENNVLFRIIVIVVVGLMGFIVLRAYVPRVFKFIKRKSQFVTLDKTKLYELHASEYVTKKQGASFYFKLYLLPCFIMTVAIIVNLASLGVIPLTIQGVSVVDLFGFSFIAIVIMTIVFMVIHFKLSFDDVPEIFLPKFVELLPHDYYTVTTSYCSKYDFESDWSHVDSYTQTYDANADENFQRGAQNIFGVVMFLVTSVFYALFNYLDATLNVVYHIVLLPFRRRHLKKAQQLFDYKMEDLINAKKLYDCDNQTYLKIGSAVKVIDNYVEYKYYKNYYNKAKKIIEKKKGKDIVLYKNPAKNIFYANVLKDFIAEYKKGDSTCYLYTTEKGLVEYEIFGTGASKEKIVRASAPWGTEVNVPFVLSVTVKEQYEKYPAHYFSKLNGPQYYYLKSLIDGGAPLTDKVTVLWQENDKFETVKTTLQHIQLDDTRKKFSLILDKEQN